MIDNHRLAQTFKQLVMIDSISGEEGAVSEAIREMLSPLEPEVFIDGSAGGTGSETGNLVLRFSGNTNAPPIMLNAHMDTVEPGRGVVPAFSEGVFTSSTETILGADDKSAVAIVIEVLRVIRENNLPHGPIDLVLTTCEEIGLLGAKHLDASLVRASFGYALDTSDTDAIITGAPGANHIEIQVHGKDAHAGAEPEKGINAILLASRALSGLTLGRIDPETTCNIGLFQSGRATNIVPRHALVKGEVRSHDEEKLFRVSRDMTSAFERVADDFRRSHGEEDLPKVEVKVEKEFSAFAIPEDHPVLALALEAARSLGRSLHPKRTNGGSDANVFFEKGIMTAVLGTGMADVHSTRESVSLFEMEKSAELLIEIIGRHSRLPPVSG
jgi:tripeptide aminopeptidase